MHFVRWLSAKAPAGAGVGVEGSGAGSVGLSTVAAAGSSVQQLVIVRGCVRRAPSPIMSQLRLSEMLEKIRAEERVREAERLERLVARCGPAVHLVPDTLLVARNITDYHPPTHQALIASNELAYTIGWVTEEPAMTALQGSRAAAARRRRRRMPPLPARRAADGKVLQLLRQWCRVFRRPGDW